MAAPTPNQQAILDAAKSLTPDKSLERIEGVSKLVLASLALVGTVLTGFGLFSDAAERFRNDRALLWLPLGLAALSGVLALLSFVRWQRSRLDLAQPVQVGNWFERNIRVRGLLATLSLVALVAAILSAAAVSIAYSPSPTATAALSGVYSSAKVVRDVEVSVSVTDAEPGDVVFARVAGVTGKGGARLIYRHQSVVGPEGTATLTKTLPSGLKLKRYRLLRLRARVDRDGRDIAAHTIEVPTVQG